MSPETSSSQPTPLTVVDRIPGGTAIPSTREALGAVVETPLLAACQDFYDKNIRTIISSANAVDISRGYAFITLDFSSMSEENKRIAKEIEPETTDIPLNDGGVLTVIGIKFPVTSSTSIEELSEGAMRVAKEFKMQPMLWAPVFTLAEAREARPGLTDEELIASLEEDWYYYDPEEGKIYLSEEHYLKTKGSRTES